MSGHSKWSKIKRKKGVLDAKRSKLFTKVLKEIIVAVKEGGGDPDGNSRLRLAVTNAKGINMPKENIERAIKKASDKDSEKLMEAAYEGYAPGGVAVFVECLTGNINRTVSNMRAIFNRGNGNLGTSGSLEFLFERKGVFTVPVGDLNEDDFTLEVIDAGAEDVSREGDVLIIYTAFEDFGKMQKKLEKMGIAAENAVVQRIPKTTTTLDLEQAKKVLKLIDAFEEDDDVQNVYHNLEMTDELNKFLFTLPS